MNPAGTALVTGSAGFVGRHMVAALARAGWKVFGCDVVSPHPPPSVREGVHVLGWMDCRKVFAAPERYDLIVHCAATVGGRATIEGAPLATAVNLGLDAEMFGYAARTKPRRVIYFSSSAVYPVEMQCVEQAPGFGYRLHEDDVDLAHPRLPDQVYGWAKLTGELLAERAREQGVPVTVLRPFSGYGADQALDYPFPSFIDRAVRRVDPFPIWGSGRQVRDWVHIDDITATVMRAIEWGWDGPTNIGWGEPTNFLELARMVTTQAGYAPEIVTEPDAPSGVSYRVADPTRMYKLRAPLIPLAEGVARALRARAQELRGVRA